MNAPKLFNALSRLGVLGNAITREYEVGRETGQAGLWRIHEATKRSTGQRVSVFLFDKKMFDTPMFQMNVREREQVSELLKREAMQLTRLRHPSILEVVEAVDESRGAIAFATEPLIATLGDLLHGRRRGQVADDGEPFELDELEIQKGLLQMAKGLQFCHQDARLVHCNITPDSVFINSKGDWKLGGFAFSTFTNRPNTGSSGAGGELSLVEMEDVLPENCLPLRDYMAPERAFDRRIDFPGDMFSFGCLIHALYYEGDPPLRAGRSTSAHRSAFDAIEGKSFEQIPVGLRAMVHQMLRMQSEIRPSAASFQQCAYFDNLLVSTIRFLETFCEKSREQKSQFLKGLPRVLPQFPDRVLKKKILSLLLEEIKDHSLLPLILPSVLEISEKTSSHDFTARVLPCLKPLFSMKEPAAAVMALLDKVSVLQKKTSSTVFKEEVLPLVITALDSPTPAVQERALKVVPTLAEALDYTAVKNSIFPKAQALYCSTNVLSVKVSTLICFHAMLKTLDKYTIVERLLPMLRQATSREPAVIMASLVVYDEVGRSHVDKEQVASDILPELWKMCMDPSLKLAQFKKFMQTIHDLSEKIEALQCQHLGEMKRMDDGVQSTTAASTTVASSLSPPAGTSSDVSMNDFKDLLSGDIGGMAAQSGAASTTINGGNFDSFASLVGSQTNSLASVAAAAATVRPTSLPSMASTLAATSVLTSNTSTLNQTKDPFAALSSASMASTQSSILSGARTAANKIGAASISASHTLPNLGAPLAAPLGGSMYANQPAFGSTAASSLSSALFPPPPPPSASSPLPTSSTPSNAAMSSSQATTIFTSLPTTRPPSANAAPLAPSMQPMQASSGIRLPSMTPLTATATVSPPVSGSGRTASPARKNFDLSGFDPLL